MEPLTAKQKEQLESHTPVLIQRADDFVARMKEKKANGFRAGNKPIYKIPDKRQFMGLVEAGQQASCLAELELFIRYKEAKQGTADDWKGLAAPLVEIIEQICGLVPAELQLPLTQRFLGYLMWDASVMLGGVK